VFCYHMQNGCDRTRARIALLGRLFKKCADVLKWRTRGAAARAAAASHAARPGGGLGVRRSARMGLE